MSAVARSIFGLLTLMATAARAEEAVVKQTYYSADSWAVTMHGAEFEGIKPNSCAIQSTLWANKKVVFSLLNKDDATSYYGLALVKNGWNLPATTPPKVTPVKVSSSNDSPQVTYFSSTLYMIADSDTLSHFFKTNATFGPMDSQAALDAALIHMVPPAQQAEELRKQPEIVDAVALADFTAAFESIFNTEGDPAGVAISFGGNEPVWSIPSVSRYESAQLNSALKTCVADMTRLNSDGNTLSNTSPLGNEN